MTDIPKAVRETARDLLYDLWSRQSDDGPFQDWDDHDIDLIALAILAERERCATLADMEEAGFCDPRIRDSLHSRGARDASNRIADAIRRGDAP